MTVEQIARVCHEANKGYCESIGDVSQVSWDDAPDWQKYSAVVMVGKALDGATPEQLHESWSAQKVGDGWVYGPVKDAEAKTHPCLVAYRDLPESQQVKDRLFVAVVRALCE